MHYYYLGNLQNQNGIRLIHRQGCAAMPTRELRTFLGSFHDYPAALLRAGYHHNRCQACPVCLSNYSTPEQAFRKGR